MPKSGKLTQEELLKINQLYEFATKRGAKVLPSGFLSMEKGLGAKKGMASAVTEANRLVRRLTLHGVDYKDLAEIAQNNPLPTGGGGNFSLPGMNPIQRYSSDADWRSISGSNPIISGGGGSFSLPGLNPVRKKSSEDFLREAASRRAKVDSEKLYEQEVLDRMGKGRTPPVEARPIYGAPAYRGRPADLPPELPSAPRNPLRPAASAGALARRGAAAAEGTVAEAAAGAGAAARGGVGPWGALGWLGLLLSLPGIIREGKELIVGSPEELAIEAERDRVKQEGLANAMLIMSDARERNAERGERRENMLAGQLNAQQQRQLLLEMMRAKAEQEGISGLRDDYIGSSARMGAASEYVPPMDQMTGNLFVDSGYLG